MHALTFMVSLALSACVGVGAESSPSGSGMQLVSQTFNGAGKMTIKSPTPMLPGDVKLSLVVDMEEVRYRMDEKVVMDISKYNITSSMHMSVIFESSTKRFTTFMDTEVTGPYPKSKKSCTVGSFPTLHEPAVVKKCIEDALANAVPTGSEGGLTEYKASMPMPGMKGAGGAETFFVDDNKVLKKIKIDVVVPQMTQTMELTDPDAKAGVVDASVFTTPAEWGNCTKTAVPPPPADMPHALKDLMKCVGVVEAVSEVIV